MHNTNGSNEDNTCLQHRAQCSSGTNDTTCTSLLLNFCKNYNIYTVAKLLYSDFKITLMYLQHVADIKEKKQQYFPRCCFFPNPVNMHKFSLMTNVLQLNPVCSFCQYIPSSAPKKVLTRITVCFGIVMKNLYIESVIIQNFQLLCKLIRK